MWIDAKKCILSMMKSDKTLSVITPVYNEENNIQPFLDRLIPVLEKLSPNYEIIFSMDPCTDETEKVIMENIKKNSSIKLLLMSRRFGQPAATQAGILNCSGDYCVAIDVDLQDPPELIEEMYEKALDGYDVVLARRKSRKGETFIKRIIARTGYYLIKKLSDVEIPENTGDYRLISRRVIDQLRNLQEKHGFLRGLVAYVGFKQTYVTYDRGARFADSGKYSRLTGSIKIGLNGLIGFSTKPLFIMSLLGFILASLSFLIGMFYFLSKIFGADITPGLPTTVILITFFSGVQLIGLGLIGEYIGRIYDEVKRRPMYIIDKKVGFKKD